MRNRPICTSMALKGPLYEEVDCRLFQLLHEPESPLNKTKHDGRRDEEGCAG